MKRTSRPKRKQPLRMTPPLVLREENDGARHIVEVGDSITTAGGRYHSSGRAVAFLTLGPGLEVQVRSRCVSKRRVTHLVVTAAAG